MPATRKLRAEVYNNAQAVRFVHYTTAEAAIQILESKTVWLRNTMCMSDYREVHHGIDLIGKFFSNENRRKVFVDAIDSCAPDLFAESAKLFEGWLQDIRNHTYISCVSVHDPSEDLRGRLSMWRAFGATPARVAIVLAIPWYTGAAEALGVGLFPVAYHNDVDASADFERIIQNVNENVEFLRSLQLDELRNWIFLLFQTAAVCSKHPGFREEREWRVVYAPNRGHSPLIHSEIRALAGIPQRIFKLPLDEKVSDKIAGLDLSRILDRIIVGPTQYPIVIYDALVETLNRIGIPDPTRMVFASDISIRT